MIKPYFERFCLCVFSLLIPSFSISQTREEIMSDSDHYLYGEGYGLTLQEAKEVALKDLLGKIRISVSNETSAKLTPSCVTTFLWLWLRRPISLQLTSPSTEEEEPDDEAEAL